MALLPPVLLVALCFVGPAALLRPWLPFWPTWVGATACAVAIVIVRRVRNRPDAWRSALETALGFHGVRIAKGRWRYDGAERFPDLTIYLDFEEGAGRITFEPARLPPRFGLSKRPEGGWAAGLNTPDAYLNYHYIVEGDPLPTLAVFSEDVSDHFGYLMSVGSGRWVDRRRFEFDLLSISAEVGGAELTRFLERFSCVVSGLARVIDDPIQTLVQRVDETENVQVAVYGLEVLRRYALDDPRTAQVVDRVWASSRGEVRRVFAKGLDDERSVRLEAVVRDARLDGWQRGMALRNLAEVDGLDRARLEVLLGWAEAQPEPWLVATTLRVRAVARARETGMLGSIELNEVLWKADADMPSEVRHLWREAAARLPVEALVRCLATRDEVRRLCLSIIGRRGELESLAALRALKPTMSGEIREALKEAEAEIVERLGGRHAGDLAIVDVSTGQLSVIETE